jgi:phospholipase D1/2
LSDRIVRPGRNCWKVARASRVAFLVDASAYYSALAQAAEQARESIIVLGWDFDARVRLRRDATDSELPSELGPFLHALVRRRPALRVRVLAWDVSVVFGLDRAFLPFQRLRELDRRVH